MTECNKKVLKDKKRIRPKKSEVSELVASSKKLYKLTGWKPKYSLDRGLQETIEWWINRKKVIKLERILITRYEQSFYLKIILKNEFIL